MDASFYLLVIPIWITDTSAKLFQAYAGKGRQTFKNTLQVLWDTSRDSKMLSVQLSSRVGTSVAHRGQSLGAKVAKNPSHFQCSLIILLVTHGDAESVAQWHFPKRAVTSMGTN